MFLLDISGVVAGVNFFFKSHYNLGECIFRLVGYSGVFGHVGIGVRAKTRPNPGP